MKNNRKNRKITYIRVKNAMLKNPEVNQLFISKISAFKKVPIDYIIHKMWGIAIKKAMQS